MYPARIRPESSTAQIEEFELIVVCFVDEIHDLICKHRYNCTVYFHEDYKTDSSMKANNE